MLKVARTQDSKWASPKVYSMALFLTLYQIMKSGPKPAALKIDMNGSKSLVKLKVCDYPKKLYLAV